MVAVGDKSVFFDGAAGSACIARLVPYLAVFSDPVVRSPAERGAFLDALFALRRATSIGVRCSTRSRSDWIPLLHDRGYHFFKLGEEAHVHLDRLTLEGHAGKMTRQILRRAERDGVAFRILQPAEIDARMAESGRDLGRLAAGEARDRTAVLDRLLRP